MLPVLYGIEMGCYGGGVEVEALSQKVERIHMHLLCCLTLGPSHCLPALAAGQLGSPTHGGTAPGE